MARFHELKVREVRRETKDTVSVAFDVPETLATDFAFIPGQYLTLKTPINGEDVRRSYSICTSPNENDLRVAVKKVDGGLFSTFANEVLKAGDQLEVMAPVGKFVVNIDPSNQKHYVAFAAGSGITPVISIIKSVLESEPNSEFTLFYGNRSFSTIIFREQLEALKNSYMGRFTIHHVLSGEDQGSALLNGRINAEKVREFFKFFVNFDDVDEYFICGPESMIHDVKDVLAGMGADKKQVHFELFTSPLGKLNGSAPEEKKEKSSGNVNCSVKIILDGDSFEFELNTDGENILDAALKQGADLPFACKGGVCCTCRAKLQEGEVDMEVNYALEEEEVERGFILTCQSHPTSERVVVDFDEV